MTLTKDREAGWLSYRDFVVDAIVRESETAKSFYLVPADGGPLAPYLPGQHLPIRIAAHERNNSVIRCYTLSDVFNGQYYRLTIKRQGPPVDRPHLPAGVSSAWFHDHLQPGDVLQAKMPNGRFCLDLSETHPVALIAGGIGVTPMMSMLTPSARQDARARFIFSCAAPRRGSRLSGAPAGTPRPTRDSAHAYPLSATTAGDRPGLDFDAVGRIDASLLRQLSAEPNTEYFLCGPPGMMQAVATQLRDAGAQESRIRTESFGPSALVVPGPISDKRPPGIGDQRHI